MGKTADKITKVVQYMTEEDAVKQGFYLDDEVTPSIRVLTPMKAMSELTVSQITTVTDAFDVPDVKDIIIVGIGVEASDSQDLFVMIKGDMDFYCSEIPYGVDSKGRIYDCGLNQPIKFDSYKEMAASWE